jgi:hypothetical protein
LNDNLGVAILTNGPERPSNERRRGALERAIDHAQERRAEGRRGMLRDGQADNRMVNNVLSFVVV